MLNIYDIKKTKTFSHGNWQLEVWEFGVTHLLKLINSQHTRTHAHTHMFQHFLLRNMNTVSRKPHFGHPTRHFISFETSGGAQPFPNSHHYECMSMRCKWQGCIVRWAHSGSATWHSWMGCRGLSGGEGVQRPQRPIEGLQTRYKTGTGPPSLPWDGRRRLLLGTDWMEGLSWKNWREEVYYHHVTLPSFCRWLLCPLLHIHCCLMWFTTASYSHSVGCCVFCTINHHKSYDIKWVIEMWFIFFLLSIGQKELLR